MTIIQANKYFYLRRGAERYVLDLSNLLRREGHDVIPFAINYPENLPTPYSRYFPTYLPTERVSYGWRGLKTFGRMLYSLSARRGMADLIQEVSPDLCHVHNIYTQLSPSILDALGEEGIPMVMTVHDHHLISPSYNIWAEGCGPDYSAYGIWQGTFSRFHKHSLAASFAQMMAYKLHRWLHSYERHVRRFFVPSVYLKERMVRAGFSADRIIVNPYGIDPAVVKPEFDGKGYFLFVGQLTEEKGVDLIIRLARLLPDLSFKIAGTGPDESYLHRLGDTLENVEFLGFRQGEDLWKLYQGAAALLMPSRVNETFGLTALEAMAAGTPVLASNVGGLPEVVEDRTTGFVMSPTDIPAWAEAVMRCAYDEGLRRRLGMNARRLVEDRFSMKGHLHRLVRGYEEAIRENLSSR